MIHGPRDARHPGRVINSAGRLPVQPYIDAAVAGAGAAPIAGRREETVVATGRGVRVRAMQIGGLIDGAMAVVRAS